MEMSIDISQFRWHLWFKRKENSPKLPLCWKTSHCLRWNKNLRINIQNTNIGTVVSPVHMILSYSAESPVNRGWEDRYLHKWIRLCVNKIELKTRKYLYYMVKYVLHSLLGKCYKILCIVTLLLVKWHVSYFFPITLSIITSSNTHGVVWR